VAKAPAPKKSVSPFKKAASKAIVPVDPENSDSAAWLAGGDVMNLPLDDDRAETEYTVSPFRALLADRPRNPQKGEHIPTAKTRRGVMYASGLGLPQEAIARIMGIGIDTLKKHYEEELFAARHVMVNDIQTNLFNIARDPNHKGTVQAGIFLLSKLGGDEYRDKKSVELTGKDGQPLQIDQRTQTVDPTMLSMEQRDALREIMTAAISLARQPATQPIEGEYTEVTNENSDNTD